ncbi:cupin domain-containing protein [Pseudonocardia sp.]|jgi:mannose-6-phosphate isomerase-like protein (cupin superfamily)|uniref:cupin domain-containing protein n=1 Tax=Pseudonocardia sp. TaxID=60912 RepID=UPI00262F4C0D|nr:cupin domain-containing protein [Pseudonocardia sp.]MCW2722304.1 Cupin 2 barrel domain protein [Pseudonocardia sp.]
MSDKGIIRQPGEANGVWLKGTQVLFLNGAGDADGGSAFEMRAAPGFDTGAHRHSRIEEYFYVVDGEIEARAGERSVVGGPGTFVFVPKGMAHSIANRSPLPATFIFFTSPPGHERYFQDLADVLAIDGPPDIDAIAAVRARYDTEQISTLRTG